MSAGPALELAASTAAVGAPLGVGLYASARPGSRRFGRLLIATAPLSAAIALSLTRQPVLFSAGRVALWIGEAWLIFLMLAFPSGRLTRRPDRWIVAAAALLIGLLYVPTALLVARYPEPSQWLTCGRDCPGNAFMVPAREPGIVSGLVVPVREALSVAVLLAVAARLAWRARTGTRLARITIVPVLAVAAARTVILAAVLAARGVWPESALVDVGVWVISLAIVAFAGAFLAGLLRWWVYVGASLRRLAAQPPLDDLAAALRRAFEDPGLEIRYPFAGGWIDASGQSVAAPAPGAGTGVTEIRDRGRVAAALVHDPALQAEPAFADAATAYATLTLENRRLAAAVGVLRNELRDSRARLEGFADSERKRIGRDLHDGAQQRLIALSIRLETAAERVGGDPREEQALLRAFGDEVEAALSEVRSIANGSYPPVLVRRGLAHALSAAAGDAPIPTTVVAGRLGQLPPEIETAIYFCCLEALQNAAKHARGATAVRIALDQRPDGLWFQVSDNGRGFDPARAPKRAGLGNMRARIAAVGGRLALDAAPGRGTRVSATVPLRRESPAIVPAR